MLFLNIIFFLKESKDERERRRVKKGKIYLFEDTKTRNEEKKIYLLKYFQLND